MQTLGVRLQVGCSLVVAVVAWIVPGEPTSGRLRLTAMLLGFALYAVVVDAAIVRFPRIRLASIAVDVLAIFSFAFAFPSLRVAVMIVAMLPIAFHTAVAGRLLGLALSAETFALAVGAGVVASGSEPGALTLGVYGVALIAFTVMIDGLSVERRRQAAHLARLYAAVEELTADPDLPSTLASIAAAATKATEAMFSVVLLREGDHLEQSATTRHDVDSSVGVELTRQALAAPDTSPSAVALASGEPVLVVDFATDTRYAEWAGVAHSYGFGSMISVPLVAGVEPLGVLNSYGPPHAFDRADVTLLVAYARQAGLTLARSLAFEREREAAARLAEADRLKSDFVGTVSHELRTPLTSIVGFVDTLLMHWDRIADDEKRRLLSRASWNASELRSLVEEILSFTRADAGGPQVVLGHVALRNEVTSIVEHMLPAIGDRVIAIDIPYDLEVLADAQALHHIVRNLVSNAAKFSPEGSRIAIGATVDAGSCTVTVADEGAGIPDEELERVFERFWRGDATSHTRGTGIGLAVVRSFVEQMGGAVWVTSEPGRGSTFAFTLGAASSTGAEATTSRFGNLAR
ncbi:MAG TPA: ATP-binding protein [Acidimicrobiales bacterium]|nr:ATP-binding protein [Acidimicrobiales bacterium]